MELLQHVWELKRATVADVHARVLAYRNVAYTTVMTVMKKLADKGYLRYEKDGAAYVYYPARQPEQVRSRVLSDIIDKVFSGSRTALVLTLVNQGEFSEREWEEIKGVIDSMDRGADEPDEEGGAP